MTLQPSGLHVDASASLDALATVANDLAGQFRLQPLLERILRSAVDLLGCSSGSLCLIDQVKRTYRKEIDLATDCAAGQVFPLDEGVTGAVARAGAPVLFDHYSQVPHGHRAPTDAGYEHAVLAVPIQLRRELIGALVVFADDEERRFSNEDAELLQRFATHAAIAIANSRLHEQAAERSKAAAISAERERAMLEIHDTVGRNLVTLVLQLDHAHQLAKDGHPVVGALGTARALAEAILTNGRNALWGRGFSRMQGPVDDLLRLELDWTQATTGVPATLRTFGDPQELAPEVADQLVRIAQECLTNVAQHARASTIRLGLVYGGDGVAIIVEDDGVGFDPDTSAQQGVGLSGLVARAAQVGGRVQIDSTPGWGTRIRADLPYRPELRPNDDVTRPRVVVLHDRATIRAGLVSLLGQSEPGVHVVAEVGEVESGLDAVRLLRPAVVLVGTRVATGREDELASTLAAAEPPASVVVMLDETPADAELRAWATAGARGFVPAESDAKTLGRAIMAASRGEAVVSGGVLEQLGGLPDPDRSQLTAREREVLGLLKQGLADKQIASHLEISVKTVEKHAGRVLHKLGCRSRTEVLASVAG